MTKHYEQRKEANLRYLAKLDEIKVRIPAGQKATLQAAAQAAGLSVNEFTQRALLAHMGLDAWPEEDQKKAEE